MRKAASAIAAITLAAITMMLLAFFSAAPAHAAASWNVQIVDTKAWSIGNTYCPIVLDSDNVPSIAYTGNAMNYGRWNSSLGGFSIQKIPALGFATDMALDTNNNPNILYEEILYEKAGAGVGFASWTGLNWTIQTVDTSGTVYASLALDSSGNPHAAYSTGKELKYAIRTGSNWTIQNVDTGTEIRFYLTLALDSNGKPYILYQNSDFKMATLENSGWNIQNVSLPDKISDVGTIRIGNMVLDSEGYPHLVYLSGIPPTIKYARYDGFTWKTQTVVSGLSLLPPVPIGSLALDSLDYPHIAYVNGVTLMYAGWTGAEWNIQTAYTDSPVHGPVSLALDSNRIPHISFRANPPSGAGSYMMYATAMEPVPLYSSLPLQLVLTAVVIGAAVFVVYLWKKKT